MRILVIEDEPRIQAFVRRGLEAEGYGVVAAGDGRDGLSLALSGDWDLVVLDLLLPGLSACACSRSSTTSIRSCRSHPLRARRPADEAQGIRARRDRLRREAVRARRAARAHPRPAAAGRAARRGRPRPARGRRRPRPRTPPGARRRRRHRSLRPRVPPPPPPAPARGRGDQPRAAAGRRLGLRLRPGLQRRRRLRAAAAAEARHRRPHRDGPECGLPPGCGVTASRSRAPRSRRRTSPSMLALARPGRDPVPPHLDQPDARLRLPRLVDTRDRRSRSSPLSSRDGRRHPRRRLSRRRAVGRAVRGAADGGRCSARWSGTPTGARQRRSTPRRWRPAGPRCSSASGSSCTTPRTSCARR